MSPSARRGLSTQPLDDAPPLAAALQEQLGLKLESHEGTAEVIVIERIQRPTDD